MYNLLVITAGLFAILFVMALDFSMKLRDKKELLKANEMQKVATFSGIIAIVELYIVCML